MLKLKEISVVTLSEVGNNLSGEVLTDWIPSDTKIFGRIVPGTSVENFGSSRNDVEDGITIYIEGVHSWITSSDRLVINSQNWEIVGNPALWENSRGYRSITVITAKKVEG